eukprot:GGOE01058388.1.p2 GENE.GGOE01058388.1~~GGOE01058388.1.p2  ORF type:complete len:152 (-),score=18.37 GGOE01058388.1:659-1114(-)
MYVHLTHSDPPWDVEGEVHFSRRAAQQNMANIRTDPITHFTPLWTAPYRVDRSSSGLVVMSPSRKRRVPPSWTEAVSTRLGGPGHHPGDESALLPSTPRISAGKEMPSARLSRSETLSEGLAHSLSTPPAYRYGRRMPSPPARGVSIVSWT